MLSLGIQQLDFITLYTKNLAPSREFYVERLEFPVIAEVHGEFFQSDIAGVPVCIDFDTTQDHHNNLGLVVSDLPATEAALRDRNLTVRSGHNAGSQEHWLVIEDLQTTSPIIGNAQSAMAAELSVDYLRC